MQLGSPQRPDIEKVKDQNEINDKLLLAINENSKELYNALKNKIDFNNNLEGKVFEGIEIFHNNSISFPHRLGKVAKNMLILRSDNLTKGRVTSPGLNYSTCIFYLPSCVVIDSTGSTIYVSSIEGFEVNNTITDGSSNYIIKQILGNKITLNTTFIGTNLRTLLYINSSK